jgi:pimeloyl-ACP methyl ester carboxylesterase
MSKLVLRLFALVLAVGGCSTATSSHHHFVLVHGAFQGAWAWSGVATRLRSLGHEVDVVELPAHGDDATSIAEAHLAAYVARTVAAIDAAGEPVVLVGHSMGGMVISGAAEARPDRIERLVYVAAFLPESGDSLLALSSMDAGSTLGAGLTDDGSDGTLDLREEALVPIFCADCDAAMQSEILDHYRAEPSLPLTEPLTLTDAFQSVPRAYLFTTNDQAVSRAFQGAMVSVSPVIESAELATSHSPFLAQPTATADALVTLAD